MTDTPYIPLPDHDAVVRFCHRVIVKVLTDRGRADLLREYDASGCRIEDHPAGVELFVGTESVTVVTDEALRYGLHLEDANSAN